MFLRCLYSNSPLVIIDVLNAVSKQRLFKLSITADLDLAISMISPEECCPNTSLHRLIPRIVFNHSRLSPEGGTKLPFSVSHKLRTNASLSSGYGSWESLIGPRGLTADGPLKQFLPKLGEKLVRELLLTGDTFARAEHVKSWHVRCIGIVASVQL